MRAHNYCCSDKLLPCSLLICSENNYIWLVLWGEGRKSYNLLHYLVIKIVKLKYQVYYSPCIFSQDPLQMPQLPLQEVLLARLPSSAKTRITSVPHWLFRWDHSSCSGVTNNLYQWALQAGCIKRNLKEVGSGRNWIHWFWTCYLALYFCPVVHWYLGSQNREKVLIC